MMFIFATSIEAQTAMKKKHFHLLQLIFAALLAVRFASAVDFLFNGFDSSDVSLSGIATLESRILTLSNHSSFSIGRALYPSKIPTKDPNTSFVLPFSASFIFAMVPYKDRHPGHGLVFLFSPRKAIEGTSGAYLGLFNLTSNGDPRNHVFGIEFDCFRNQEFDDINANHVGVDVNSLTSVRAHEAGYWRDDGSFKNLVLNNGKTYQVWIDYGDGIVNVTMAPTRMRRPMRHLLSVPLNLSEVFEDEMFVGFTASTGDMIQSHKILAWSFSNTNSSLSDELITVALPSFTPIYRSKTFIAAVVSGISVFAIVCSMVALVFVKRSRKIRKQGKETEDWEFEYWPHRISYQEIDSATKSFADENVIGIGGNGKVYKGVLNPGGFEVAVKRIFYENGDGIRAFLSEISTLGRLKHRNLVGLRGWCKQDKGTLILVYDYMENGSLDKRVFECDRTKMLSLEERIRILKQVALGVSYLHEGWESKVLHRDIKASNVLLDREMNARLGDFGLACLHDHDTMAGTSRIVGTVGYLAPEIVRNGRASTQTDVYGYGVLVLEVICGRRPIGEGKPPLVDWAWQLFREGDIVNLIDAWLREGGVKGQEVEKVIHVGLLCTHPEASARPTMRQVVKFFEGKGEVVEGEEMDVSLLKRMRNGDVLCMYYDNGRVVHPTFQEIRGGVSSSMSISWSNTSVEGR